LVHQIMHPYHGCTGTPFNLKFKKITTKRKARGSTPEKLLWSNLLQPSHSRLDAIAYISNELCKVT